MEKLNGLKLKIKILKVKVSKIIMEICYFYRNTQLYLNFKQLYIKHCNIKNKYCFLSTFFKHKFIIQTTSKFILHTLSDRNAYLNLFSALKRLKNKEL